MSETSTPSATAPAPAADASWRSFHEEAFSGRVALVTGAAGGMGLATARAFSGRGAHVVLADVDGDGVQRAAEEVAGALPVAVDVSDEEAVDRLYRQIDDAYGRIDHVVHAAAMLTAEPFLSAPASHWRRVLDVNLVGTVNVLRPAISRMLERGSGTVVAVGSDAGHRGAGHAIADGAYAASKAGLLSVVKSLAREFAGRGVRINALAPGASDTPLLGGLSPELRDWVASLSPLGRLGRPEEVAAAALFLSSGAASFVYGTVLDVDGGSMFR